MVWFQYRTISRQLNINFFVNLFIIILTLQLDRFLLIDIVIYLFHKLCLFNIEIISADV